MSLRTPLSNVRGLGSAKEGADHFWAQRVTGIANVFLSVYFVYLVVSLAGTDFATVREALAAPWNGVLMILFILSGVYHMRLGMQVIIEDYVHHEGAKIACIMLNTFFSILVGLGCVYGLLKIGFSV